MSDILTLGNTLFFLLLLFLRQSMEIIQTYLIEKSPAFERLIILWVLVNSFLFCVLELRIVGTSILFTRNGTFWLLLFQNLNKVLSEYGYESITEAIAAECWSIELPKSQFRDGLHSLENHWKQYIPWLFYMLSEC